MKGKTEEVQAGDGPRHGVAAYRRYKTGQGDAIVSCAINIGCQGVRRTGVVQGDNIFPITRFTDALFPQADAGPLAPRQR